MTPGRPPRSDRALMQQAIDLAERGIGRVEPNPPVGAILVRGREVLGQGWHRAHGGPHAEIEAIRDVEGPVRGATVYVTLEPCNHHGKTPPCTRALIEAGIAEVVIGALDPNPTSGDGRAALEAAGVVVRVLEDAPTRAALDRLYAPFRRWVLDGQPWVLAKWAMTADGHLATASGDSRWVSSESSRWRSHHLRDECQAILVGIGTVLTDDPLLTCRLPDGGGRHPVRIVLDSMARFPLGSRMARTCREAPVLVVTTDAAPPERREAIEAAGVEVLVVGSVESVESVEVESVESVESVGGEGARVVDVRALGRELVGRGLVRLLVEGGPSVLGSFFDAGLVDEVEVFVAPKIVGGRAAPPAVGGRGVSRMDDAWRLVDIETSFRGPDLHLIGRVARVDPDQR